MPMATSPRLIFSYRTVNARVEHPLTSYPVESASNTRESIEGEGRLPAPLRLACRSSRPDRGDGEAA
jgi:hypothetical protein